ncbi:MAG: TQO small subunit DoxD [Chloroflexota bacterium]
MFNLFDSHTARFDARLYKVCMLIARLILAYLFFTQLFWKLPPTFGCGSDFSFPKPAEQNNYDTNNSSGLCYWMGLESIYASQPRQVLIADARPAGWPTISVNITPLAKLNGVILDKLFIPNIRITGWLVWLAEFWIFLSMLLGLFTRLGALVSIGVSLQLYVGLANIPRPFEWEWSYGTIVALSIAMLAAAAGRSLGVDALLRRKLAGPAGRGNRLAKIVLLLT